MNNRRRGDAFEREALALFHQYGLRGERMWGSDGRSRGLAKEVDLLVTLPDGDPIAFQCKRTKKLPKVVVPCEHVAAQLLREDSLGGGKPARFFAVVPLPHYVELVARAGGGACARDSVEE